MKAVIPAAGFGTRFLPLTKAVPKELLPVAGLPVIHHVVAEAAAAGFDEIAIILSNGKESIIRYFESDPDLENHLEKTGKVEELQRVRSVSAMARISFVYQKEMLGLGDAIRTARDFVGETPSFAVLLGDTILQGESPLVELVRLWQSHGKSGVALEPCPPERVSRYGVAGGTETEPGVFQLRSLVEKPAADQVPVLRAGNGSALPPHAFAARYLFSREIFEFLDQTQPGYGGEIQLTDAMRQLCESRGFFGVRSKAQRLDVGNPAGLIEANQAMDGGDN